MALAHCILGKFLGVVCHCFPPPLDVPTFSARCLHAQRRERPLAAESGTLRGREMFRQISSRIRLPRNSRDLLHAANLRHGTDGFTSPPKEGVLRISIQYNNLLFYLLLIIIYYSSVSTSSLITESFVIRAQTRLRTLDEKDPLHGTSMTHRPQA